MKNHQFLATLFCALLLTLALGVEAGVPAAGSARKLLQVSATQEGEGTQTTSLAPGAASVTQDAAADPTAPGAAGLGSFFDPALLSGLFGGSGGAPAAFPGFGGAPPFELPAGFAEVFGGLLPTTPAGTGAAPPGLAGLFPGVPAAGGAIPGLGDFTLPAPGVTGGSATGAIPGLPADFAIPGVGDVPLPTGIPGLPADFAIPAVGDVPLPAGIPGLPADFPVPGLGDVTLPAGIPGLESVLPGNGSSIPGVAPVDLSAFIPAGAALPGFPVPEAAPAPSPRTGVDAEAQPAATVVNCETAPTVLSISGQAYEATSCNTVPAAP